MRVLYLGRGDFKENVVKQQYHKLQKSLRYSDQDGFFEQSLNTALCVSEISVTDEYKLSYNQDYDILLVNWKQPIFKTEEERFLAIKKFLDKSTLPKVLFINAANASYLPEEKVLDAFDLVVKREPFKDRDRYSISEQNKQKIVPTIIHCPFSSSPKGNFLARIYSCFDGVESRCVISEEVYDVGFSGADAADHSLRRDVWQRVKQAGFSTVGGLQANPYTKEPIPIELSGPRLRGRAYRDSLCQARVNLALDGIGQYTFRHQELLSLGAFMMSGPSIRDLELVIPLVEDTHYVSFNDLDEMVEKIKYFLENDDARHKIAQAGRRLFNEYYDPNKHGQSLLALLKRL
jgi:Glycosyl transferases group 1